MSEPVRVLIVDDDALVRGGLRMLLSGEDGIVIVGECTDGSEVPAAVASLAPDVVLMDLRMPGVDGLTATERLRASPSPPAPEVLVLTTLQADEQVVRALRAGASGFLLKDTPPSDIIAAIHRVARGEAILSPTVTRRLIAQVTGPDPGGRAATARRDRARAALGRLSEREREVAVELGTGDANAAIAHRLHMSVATVKSHVSRILLELGLDNRVQVALLVHDAELDHNHDHDHDGT